MTENGFTTEEVHCLIIRSGSNDSTAITNVHTVFSKIFPGRGIIASEANDTVSGACILSAAELDSSKQYIHSEDGSWNLCYLLPVADGFLSKDIAMQIENKDGKEEQQILFKRGRMYKSTFGTVSYKH